MVRSKPGGVVGLGVAWVGADDDRDGEALGTGEGVGDERAVEAGCSLWGEVWGEAVFDGAWLWVFDEEEEAAVLRVCYGAIPLWFRLWAKRSTRSVRGAVGEASWKASWQVRQGQTRRACAFAVASTMALRCA